MLIHFNVHGIPDRYGKKGSLLLEPILGLLILALLMFCQRFPQWWNYPVEVTEENREHIFEIASKMMSVIKLLSIGVCLDAGISGNLGTAPMWPVWILITGIFVTLILGIRGYIRLVKKMAWMRRINREAVAFVIMQKSGREMFDLLY